MFNKGDLVIYVPSWDAEYRREPEIGSVLEVRSDSIIVSSVYGTRGIPFKWAAHTGNISEILNLIKQLNKDLVSAQHLIYCVTAVSSDHSRKAAEEYKHYHMLA